MLTHGGAIDKIYELTIKSLEMKPELFVIVFCLLFTGAFFTYEKT